MTLVVGAQNAHYALQVSDRRLTDEAGVSVDEESNKLFIFESDACRFVVGFTGLARFSGPGAFETNKWLADTLRDAGPPDFDPNRIIDRLRVEATRRFSTPAVLKLTPFARRVSIMLTGFVLPTMGPLPAYCMITNYQDYEHGVDDLVPWPEFRALWRIMNGAPPPWAVQRVGYWQPFGTSQVNDMIALVRDNKPAVATVGKAVSLIRDISGPAGSPGPIGRQLMSAVITPNDATFEYHSDFPTSTYHMPSFVYSRKSSGGLIMSGATLRAVDSLSPPVLYPRQPRNQPCACGSKIKYKRCHGA